MLKRVYIAADPIDAALIRGLLESSGIAATVRGDLLWGGRGELPLSDDTAPTVWVSQSDYPRARAIIEATQAKPAHAAWTCAACGENNEGQFAQCWRCGAVHA